MKARDVFCCTSCLAVGLIAMAALSESAPKAVDDLDGLRPDTQGVETNKFWDTRAHATYVVSVDAGASTNAVATAVRTQDAAIGDVGTSSGISIILK